MARSIRKEKAAIFQCARASHGRVELCAVGMRNAILGNELNSRLIGPSIDLKLKRHLRDETFTNQLHVDDIWHGNLLLCTDFVYPAWVQL